MIKTVYLINHTTKKDDTFNTELSEIKALSPDEIIILCIEEYDADYIFKGLIENLNPWLVENNKIAKIIFPYPDNHKFASNIIGEEGPGIIHWFNQDSYPSINKQFEFTPDIKLYTCYNNNAKVERAYLLDEIVRNDLLNDGIVTMIKPDRMLEPTGESYVWKYHSGKKLLDEPDFQLNSKPEYIAPVLPKSYLNGFIDIVCESQYRENAFFPTEKTYKPIATYKPFITLSCKNYHKLLTEKYGIELYTELFDYSFDSYDDIHDRIKGITDNLLTFKSYSKDTWKLLYEKIRPKLLRNRQQLIMLRNDKNIMIPKSLRFMTETTDYILYGHDVSKTYINYMKYRNWIKT